MAGRGFAFPRSFKGEAALRPSLEANNRVLAAHLNTFVPSYDTDDFLLINGGLGTIDTSWNPSDPAHFVTARYCDNNSMIKGPLAATAWDDEFDDGTLDADWTTLTVTGGQTITESRGVLSIVPTSAITTNDYNSLLRSYTISVGEAVEICVSFFHDTATARSLAAIITDGTTASANVAGAELKASNGQITLAEADGTLTATSSADQDVYYGPYTVFARIEYDAANSFKAWISGDGVSWYTPGAFAKTMTPTHIGFGWNNAGATPLGGDTWTVHYFRVVSV